MRIQAHALYLGISLMWLTLPLCTSMIRGEIKLFIILGCFFFWFFCDRWWVHHTSSGMLEYWWWWVGTLINTSRWIFFSFFFCLLPQSRRMREQVLCGIHLSVRHCVNTLISHIKQHVRQGFWAPKQGFLITFCWSVTGKRSETVIQQHNLPGIVKSKHKYEVG